MARRLCAWLALPCLLLIDHGSPPRAEEQRGYVRPQASSDGWPVAAAGSVQLSEKRLAAMSAAIRPRARIDERNEYGYLLWLTPVEVRGRTFAACYMSGSGGNKVFVVPQLALVAVITSENFGRRDAHQLSEQLLSAHVLESIEALEPGP